MAAFAALSLPATITGTLIDVLMVSDAGAGASISQVRHKESSNFLWNTVLKDTGTRADLDGRMWQIKCVLRSGASVTVSPTSAGQFVSYDASAFYGGQAHLYEWRRVAVAGAEENDRLWVRVLVHLAAVGDRFAKVYCWAGHERGESSTIEHVMCPVLWVQSPAETRAAENNLTASKRTRLLIPQAVPNFNGQVGVNANFFLHASVGVTKTIDGPNLQQLQFWSVTSANDLGLSFRRTLMGFTQDTVGWWKSHYYEGYSYLGTQAWSKFGAVYYPRYGKVFTRGPIENGLLPESTFGNSFSSPYPFALGALTAATNDFWYDVCNEYRTWYQAAAAPTPLASDTSRGNFAKTGGIWFGALQIPNKTSYPQATYYTRCVEVMKALLLRLDSTEHPAASYSVLHQQSTGTDFSLRMIGPFGDGNFSPYYKASTDATRAINVRASSYSMVEEFYPTTLRWPEVLPAHPFKGYKAGDPTGLTTFPYQYVDSRVRAALIQYGIQRLRVDQGATSFYLDLLTGVGSRPTYTSAGEGFGVYDTVPRHGNRERGQAKAAFIREIRAAVITGSGDANNILASESTEEHTGPFLDVTQDAYNILPFHLDVAETTIYNPATYAGSPDVTLTDHPAGMRTMSLPLWQSVHHQWSPVGRFCTMPLNIGLATNATYHPNGGFAGMTAAEMIEVHCMMAGLNFVAGTKQLYDYDSGNDFPLVQLDSTKSRAVGDATNDPADTATTILGFYKTLHQALALTFAGQFLCAGKMLRPPQVDPSSSDISKQTNPINACRKLSPLAFRGWPYLYDAGTWVSATSAATWDVGPSMTSGSQNFQVPQAKATIWQSADGTKIGLVIVNWSSSSATWKATINPAHYGATNFRVDEITLAGAPSTVGSPAGTFTIGNVSAPTVSIGALAARTVRTFLLVPV